MKTSIKKGFLISTSLFFLAAGNVINAPLVYAEEEDASIQLISSSEPPTIDPGLATDTTSSALIYQVFEGLTTKEGDQVVPGMAQDWTVSEDGLTYTFNLREANWSNGDPVSAEDFVFAWLRVLNPDTSSQYADIMYVIAEAEAYNKGEIEADAVGVRALDAETLEVQLAEATPYFPELVSFYSFMPVHQATVEANPDWALGHGPDYITNGPFVLSEWNHHANYILEKSDSYWNAEAVSLEKVEAQIVESEATMNFQFQNGEIDYLGSPFGAIALDSLEDYQASGDLQSSLDSAVYWYKFNTTDETLSNLNIRKALGLAIDRQELTGKILKGGQAPALSLVPPSVPGFEEDGDYFDDADYDRARDYLQEGLEELGLDDPSQVDLKILINSGEAHSAIAQFIQETWRRELGIDVKIDNVEWQVFIDQVRNLDYQIARMGWVADYNDAASFLGIYRTAETGGNDTGWENEDYKSLMDQANAQQDQAERLELLKEAQALLVDEMPVVTIYFYVNNYVASDKLVNIQPNAQGNVYLKDVELKEE